MRRGSKMLLKIRMRMKIRCRMRLMFRRMMWRARLIRIIRIRSEKLILEIDDRVCRIRRTNQDKLIRVRSRREGREL